MISLKRIKKILDYNMKVQGLPKLVDKDHLPKHFLYRKENIVEDVLLYFQEEPEVWHLPAKNYFVRICLALYLKEKYFPNEGGDMLKTFLNCNELLPYDDQISPIYLQDEETYGKILKDVFQQELDNAAGYQKTIDVFGKYYEPPVPYHSIAIGYNQEEQDFFDLLRTKKPYIREFYFSFTYTMPGKPLDKACIAWQLKECNQYGIPANLLLNHADDSGHALYLTQLAKEYCENLQAVSVLNIETAKRIKEWFPYLDIHISTHGAQNLKLEDIDSDLIQAVNLNEPEIYSKQQQEVIQACQEKGIRLKYIANRGCICGKSTTINRLQKTDKTECCNHLCWKLEPWTELCRTNLYKEWLMLSWKPDIIKLSTRERTTEQIKQMLDYWTSLEPTKHVGRIPVNQNNYDTFLEWCRTRIYGCNGQCWQCRKCQTFCEEMMEG